MPLRTISIRLQGAVAVLLLLFVTLTVNAVVGRAVDAKSEVVVLEDVARPITVVNGTCIEPGQPAWPLNNLAAPDGEPAGNTDSDRTQYSFTANLPYTITALLGEQYAIVVSESASSPQSILACGNIGGVTDQIGTLVVGLRSAEDVSVSGVAVLAPNASDQTRTMVSAFLTGPSLGAFDGGGTEPGTELPTQPPDQGDVPTVEAPPPTEQPVVTPTDAPIVQPTEDDDDDGNDDDDDDKDEKDDEDNSGHGGDDDDSDSDSGDDA